LSFGLPRKTNPPNPPFSKEGFARRGAQSEIDVSAVAGSKRLYRYALSCSLGYTHDGPEPVQKRLAAGEGAFQIRNLQDQGGTPFPPDGVHVVANFPGRPFSDQDEPDPGVSPALGQQLAGLGGSVYGAAGNPGQGEGQQGAGIGDDEKALVFDGVLLAAGSRCQVSGKDFDP
jgi:hypothetical protein